jgi:sialate O-acetylesterase
MKKLLLTFAVVLFFGTMTFSQSMERLMNLKGTWKFSIGDDAAWASPAYNDQSWDNIKVPSPWEDEGFYGYDGFAWYRRSISIPKEWMSRKLYIQMGYIDDADEVFFNGHRLGGMGQMPPHYHTAYNMYRSYAIPAAFINFGGKNVIAVRVFDAELSGGITAGEPGIYTNGFLAIPNLDLSGIWKFSVSDNDARREMKYDDRDWEDISVPGFWEVQGHEGYDGVAWYRKKFKLPASLSNEQLVLMLGKIDDLDEVFVNGKLIGKTGIIRANPKQSDLNENYQKFRGYYIPRDLLKTNAENVIAVRVYDGFLDGGIYEGPIGLITQSRYVEFWKAQSEQQKKVYKKSFWESIFN